MAARFEDYLGEDENAYGGGPRSALELAAKATNQPLGMGPQVADGGLRGVILLKADPDQGDPESAFQDILERTIGAAGKRKPIVSPMPGKAAIDEDGVVFLRVSQTEMLALTGYEAAPELTAAFRETLAATPEAAVLCADLSDGYAHTILRGRGARETLAKGAALDFHPKAFAPGDVRRALIGAVEAILFIRPGPDSDTETPADTAPKIEILAPRSLAASLYGWLSRAGASEVVFGAA